MMQQMMGGMGGGMPGGMPAGMPGGMPPGMPPGMMKRGGGRRRWPWRLTHYPNIFLIKI